MGDDGLCFKLENLLERRENDEYKLFQRLSAFCHDIQSKAAASVDGYFLQQKENQQKQESVNETITQLHKGKKANKTELDDMTLQRKITEKKIALADNQRSALTEAIHDAKLKKESISLEMVELTQTMEDAKKHRRDRWNAIKMACTYYKDNLDVHINVERSKDCDKVKVTLFQAKNPERDNYYIILEKRSTNWRVVRIEPALKEMHLEKTRATVDLSKPLSAVQVMAFLCRLRKSFLRHYIEQ